MFLRRIFVRKTSVSIGAYAEKPENAAQNTAHQTENDEENNEYQNQ